MLTFLCARNRSRHTILTELCVVQYYVLVLVLQAQEIDATQTDSDNIHLSRDRLHKTALV